MQGQLSYKGRLLDLKPYLSDGELDSSRKSLYKRKLQVLNIPEGCQDSQLKGLFGRFGHVQRAYVGNKNPKSDKIAGFVIFKDEGTVQVVLKAGTL